VPLRAAVFGKVIVWSASALTVGDWFSPLTVIVNSSWRANSVSSAVSLSTYVPGAPKRAVVERHERPEHTLQPTALVNEVYLRLIDQQRVSWHNRAQFFGLAAQLMRHVLVDHARTRASVKRGGLVHKLSLDEAWMAPGEVAAELIALDEALVRLAAFDVRKSRVVEMRFFGGLSVEETAEALGVSDKTVMRDWRIARMWLYRELSGSVEGDVELES
jgi:RNA polymerase sigma factor (TIGR02999 family)